MRRSLGCRLFGVWGFCSLFLTALASAQVPGLPTVDFHRYFPHLVAVSEVASDDAFPQAFQYKYLTVRDEVDHVVFVALTRREGSDRIVRLLLAKGPVEGSEKTLRDAVASFSKTVKVKFEFIDLRDIKTYAEFSDRTKSLGWGLEAVPN